MGSAFLPLRWRREGRATRRGRIPRTKASADTAPTSDGEDHGLRYLASGVANFFGDVTTGFEAIEHEETDESGTHERSAIVSRRESSR